MTILLVLIPLGLMLLGLAIAAFVWAVRHGQFEELEGEGMRILLDDGPPNGTPRAPNVDRLPCDPTRTAGEGGLHPPLAPITSEETST